MRVLQFFGGGGGESSAPKYVEKDDEVSSEQEEKGIAKLKEAEERWRRNNRPQAQLTSVPSSQQLPSNFIIKNLDEDYTSSPAIISACSPSVSANVVSTSSPSRLFIASAPPSPSSSDEGSHHQLGSPLTLTALPMFNGSPRRKGRPPAIKVPSRDEVRSLLDGVDVGGKKKRELDVFGGALETGLGGLGMIVSAGDVCE